MRPSPRRLLSLTSTTISPSHIISPSVAAAVAAVAPPTVASFSTSTQLLAGVKPKKKSKLFYYFSLDCLLCFVKQMFKQTHQNCKVIKSVYVSELQNHEICI